MNNDKELKDLVANLAEAYSSQDLKTSWGLDPDTCEAVDRLVAYVKENY